MITAAASAVELLLVLLASSSVARRCYAQAVAAHTLQTCLQPPQIKHKVLVHCAAGVDVPRVMTSDSEFVVETVT